MANGAAFDDAVAIAHQHPTLGVGCHIVLTDGIPLSPPETIPTLLGPDGRTFRPSLASFFLAALTGRIDPQDIAHEAQAQIARLQQNGIAPTHLDTHKHTHILPGVARPLLAVAEHLGIPAIRNPFEPAWSIALGKSPLLRRLQLGIIAHFRPRFLALPQIRDGRIVTTDGTLGVSATGNLNTETLTKTLAAMPEGLWELVCHPGYNDRDLDAITTRLRDTREIERAALLATFTGESANPFDIELIHYEATGDKAPAHNVSSR